jgi:hypothetical protein
LCIRTPELALELELARTRGLSDDRRLCAGADTAGASPGAIVVAAAVVAGMALSLGAGVGSSRGAGAAAAVGASFGEGAASTGTSLGAGAGATAVGASLDAAAAVGASLGAGAGAGAAVVGAVMGGAAGIGGACVGSICTSAATGVGSFCERPLFIANASAKPTTATPAAAPIQIRRETNLAMPLAAPLAALSTSTGGTVTPDGSHSDSRPAIGDGIAVSPALSCGTSPAANHAPSSASTSGVSVRTNERGAWTSTSLGGDDAGSVDGESGDGDGDAESGDADGASPRDCNVGTEPVAFDENGSNACRSSPTEKYRALGSGLSARSTIAFISWGISGRSAIGGAGLPAAIARKTASTLSPR